MQLSGDYRDIQRTQGPLDLHVLSNGVATGLGTCRSCPQLQFGWITGIVEMLGGGGLVEPNVVSCDLHPSTQRECCINDVKLTYQKCCAYMICLEADGFTAFCLNSQNSAKFKTLFSRYFHWPTPNFEYRLFPCTPHWEPLKTITNFVRNLWTLATPPA